MGDLVKKDGNGLIGIMHGNSGEPAIAKPFSRDIFLFDTYIAGTSHIDGIEELEPQLAVRDRLDFFREPKNEHDSSAIEIRTGGGAKIGYVPRKDNVIFARLMDAGKVLFGCIDKKEMRGKWLKIKIKVYLHE